jgi:hypothetical protein
VKLRFQLDADLNPKIQKGVVLREPSIDFRLAAGRLPDAMPDPEVLRLAADDGLVLVSRDVHTMIGHFQRFIASNESPGLLLLPSTRPIGAVIDGLLFVWQNWTPDDLRNQVRWLPFPDRIPD